MTVRKSTGSSPSDAGFLPAPHAGDDLPDDPDALELPDAARHGGDHPKEEAVGVDEDEDPDALEADDGDRDDAHADDLDIGDVDVSDEGGDAHDDDGFAVEHGDSTSFDDHSEARGDDDPAGEDVDFDGLGEALPPTHDDGGVEGTHDGSESDLADALPALDSGGDEELAMNELLAEVGLGDDTWEIASEQTVDAALTSVNCADGRVAAAGQVLAVLEPGEVIARVHALDELARGCLVTPAGVATLSSGGVHLRTGATEALVFQSPDVRRVGVAGDRLFALVEHTLYRLDAMGGRASVVRTDVVDFAAAAGTLVAIVRGPEACSIARMRGHDRDWEDLGPAGALGELVVQGGKLLVNGALAMAAVEAGGVAVRRTARTATRHFAIAGTIDAVFQGDAEGAALLVLTSTPDGTRLVSLGSTEPSDIAALPGGAPRAVAWDATRERLFVAGEGGLVALRPRVRH